MVKTWLDANFLFLQLRATSTGRTLFRSDSRCDIKTESLQTEREICTRLLLLERNKKKKKQRQTNGQNSSRTDTQFQTAAMFRKCRPSRTPGDGRGPPDGQRGWMRDAVCLPAPSFQPFFQIQPQMSVRSVMCLPIHLASEFGPPVLQGGIVPSHEWDGPQPEPAESC